jgi:hypothetical protein
VTVPEAHLLQALVASVSLATTASSIVGDIHRSSYIHNDREASVYRFVGAKRIERIASVYEAGVAAVA